jgi:hypothetical protein
MSLAIQRAAFFIADFEIQFAWYVEKRARMWPGDSNLRWMILFESSRSNPISGDSAFSGSKASETPLLSSETPLQKVTHFLPCRG